MSQSISPLELARAINLADYLTGELAAFCDHIETVGSIRRRMLRVNDIELLMIPKFGVGKSSTLFDDDAPLVNLALQRINELEQTGVLTKRLRSDGKTSWGKRQQFALMGNVSIDLFHCLDPEQWGVQHATRTGPAEFSKSIVTQRRSGGFLEDYHEVRNGRVYLHGHYEPLNTPTEEAFLCNFCGFSELPDPQIRHELTPDNLKNIKVLVND